MISLVLKSVNRKYTLVMIFSWIFLFLLNVRFIGFGVRFTGVILRFIAVAVRFIGFSV